MLAPLPTHRKQLLDAADLIEKRGHIKHFRCDESGGLCVHGAIALVETGSPHRGGSSGTDTMRLLASYLRSKGVPELSKSSPEGITKEGGCAYWNNAPERTGAEVASALRGAALHGL